MKSLVNYLIEGFKLNSKTVDNTKTKKYDKSNYQEAIYNLQEEAKKKNCKITFKNHPGGNTGDFTIFCYKSDQKRYDVGCDGDWDGESFEFDKCYNDALNWLEKQN